MISSCPYAAPAPLREPEPRISHAHWSPEVFTSRISREFTTGAPQKALREAMRLRTNVFRDPQRPRAACHREIERNEYVIMPQAPPRRCEGEVTVLSSAAYCFPLFFLFLRVPTPVPLMLEQAHNFTMSLVSRLIQVTGASGSSRSSSKGIRSPRSQSQKQSV